MLNYQNRHPVALGSSRLVVSAVCLLAILTSGQGNGLRFTEEPRDTVITLDGALWWNCLAVAEDTISYSWHYGSAEMLSRDGKTIYSNGTLHIATVSPHDFTSTYTCVATSGGESIESREATLHMAYISGRFSDNPASQNVTSGNRVILSCQIQSLPTALITWHQDGEPVAMDKITMTTPGRSIVTLTSVTYTDAGSYKCQASNPLLTLVRYSEEAEVIVQGPPVFLTDLQPQYVPLDFTAVFDCHHFGNPDPQVSWYRHLTSADNSSSSVSELQDGDKYSISASGTLLVRNATELDAGSYTCRLVNMFGEVSASTNLTVTGEATLPVFTSTPRDRRVIEGDNVTLLCLASGNPPPQVTWVTNGDGNRYTISDEGQLVVMAIQDSDAGGYTCVASNPRGQVNFTVFLDVQVRPRFVSTPDDVTVLAGQIVVLPCVAFGNPRPNITWTVPTAETYAAPSEIRDSITVDDNGTLTVVRVERRHHGKYTCLVENLVGAASVSASVSVEVPPEFIRLPVSVAVTRGERVFFHCLATGSPTPTLYWTRDGEPRRLGTGTSNGRQVYLNNTLVFHSAEPENAGVYRCHAENTRGSIQSVATLMVSVPPVFTVAPANQTVAMGSHVQLDCVAMGNPVPSQKWFKDGRELVPDDETEMLLNYTLIIHSVGPSHTGEYTCTATNVVGTATITITVEIKDFPKFSVEPSNTTINQSETLVLHCQGVAMETPSVKWYRQFPMPTWSPVLIGGTGRTVVNDNGDLVIKNVTAADSTWYRCAIFNSVGYINSEVFVTVQVLPDIQQTNSPRTVLRQTSVTLTCQSSGNPVPSTHWTSPHGHVITGSDSAYRLTGHTLQIVLANERRDGGNWTCQSCNVLGCAADVVQLTVEGEPVIQRLEVNRNSSGVYLKCVVTGLPPATFTFMAAGQPVTSDTKGHTVMGNLLEIGLKLVKTQYSCEAYNKYGKDTVSVRVPGTLQAPSIMNITSRSITVSWTALSEQNSLPLLGYRVEYSSDDGSTWFGTDDTVTADRAVIGSLTPFTDFLLRVAAVNVLGVGQFSQLSAPVSTLPDVPSPPENVMAIKLAYNTILLSWERPLQVNDDIANIEYWYEVIGEMDLEMGETFNITQQVLYNETLQREITNLTRSLKYNVTVWARNVRLGENSAPVTVSVDLSLSGRGRAEDGLSPDKIIAVVFGVLGAVVIVLLVVFVLAHVRQLKMSESMSLVNPRSSLDQFCEQHHKSMNLYPGNMAGFSLKRRLSSGQGFYQLEEDGFYDNTGSEGNQSAATDRLADRGVLLVASNPLYDRVQYQVQPDTVKTTPADLDCHTAMHLISQSYEQREVELPGAADNFVLEAAPQNSPTGSDVTQQALQQQDLEETLDLDLAVLDVDRSLDEIYCLGLTEQTTVDHLYDVPSDSRGHSPSVFPECSDVTQPVETHGRPSSPKTYTRKSVIQEIPDTSIDSIPVFDHSTDEVDLSWQREVGEDRCTQRDLRISYDASEDEVRAELSSAALY